MKIAYLNPSGQLGGAEIALLDLLTSVRAEQPDWFLHLLVGADGPLVSRAESIGVCTTVLPFPPELARLGDSGMNDAEGAKLDRSVVLRRLFYSGSPVLKYVGELKRALRRINPDLLHTNGFKMHILGARARTRKSLPIVWHVRDYVSSRPLMARLMRWHKRRCSVVVTNSQSVARDVSDVCGTELKVYPVLDAIDLEKFTPLGYKLDLDLLSGLPNVEPGTIRIGLLATMARWKGHMTFLEALNRLPSHLKFRGYVIGGALYQTDGSQHSLEELRGEAARLGLGERVGFTGFVEDPASAMRALDIVVHASTKPEPFGLVIAEAMASGRSLIASQAGGAAEIIDAEIDALGHEPGNVGALATCMTRLASDAALRKRLSDAGRLKAARKFDLKRLALELVPIYREVLSTGT